MCGCVGRSQLCNFMQCVDLKTMGGAPPYSSSSSFSSYSSSSYFSSYFSSSSSSSYFSSSSYTSSSSSSSCSWMVYSPRPASLGSFPLQPAVAGRLSSIPGDVLILYCPPNLSLLSSRIPRGVFPWCNLILEHFGVWRTSSIPTELVVCWNTS